MTTLPHSSSPIAASSSQDSPAVLRLRGVDKTYYEARSVGGSIKEALLAVLERESHATRVDALVGIDLEVLPGEMLGVVGANGSGKSTLLKIMAGITQPTHGEVETRGRVVGMIELGAGFHFELTGEENVRLQGSVYGLSHDEITAAMDSVFEFAGVSSFRATPLKFYSTGMIARLGFAIAMLCKPDVLLVDEVLAVGDQEFQDKCLDSMRELRKHGVAIVLVTHAMDLAERMCDRIVWLRDGRMAAQGSPTEVLSAWQREQLERTYAKSEGKLDDERIMTALPGRFGTGEARMEYVRTVDVQGRERFNFAPGEPFGIEIGYTAQPEVAQLESSLTLEYELGLAVAVWASAEQGVTYRPENGRGIIRIWFDAPIFQPGHYVYTPAITPVGGFDNHYDLHFRMNRFRITDPGGQSPTVPLLLEGALSIGTRK